MHNWLFLVSLVSLSLFADAPARAQSDVLTEMRDEITAARNQLTEPYAERIAQLAERSEAEGLGDPARVLRQWLPKRDPLKLYIFKLPESLEPPTAFAANDAAKAVWQSFVELRREKAAALFELAQKAHAEKHYALSYDLVRAACREDPDHAAARAILGYVRYRDRWQLPDTARRLAAGQVDHAKFGWLPAAHVKRYENNARYWRGNWITLDEDERLHNSIKSGWRVESEHYVVTTNHSLEEGVALSRRLEKLYDAWRHVFIDYYTPETEIARWFETKSEPAKPLAGTPRRQHEVVHFRNRDEYNATLRPALAQIEITLGIYFAQPRTAYFFAGDEQYDGTLLHEATHQLFQETRAALKEPGSRANFWAIEAVACHMESLVEHEHWYTLGGFDEGRVPAAHQRAVQDGFYVPLRDVTALGMRDLQRDERLPKIYSQISGQAFFFLQANGGRYRKPFVDYLAGVYTAKPDASKLAALCGKSYEQLDEEYLSFMRMRNEGIGTGD